MLRRFLILFLVGALLLLTACHKTMSADALMRNLLAAYPFPQGQIYSSEEKVNSGRHLTDEMLSVLYGEGERPLYHSLAVLLFADIDHVVECGIFVIRDGVGKLDDIIFTEAMFSYRLKQIALAFPEAEGKILRYGNTLVYIVTPDNARAERCLERLL